ncbi:MAG: flavoprotein [Candidatus Brocadiaceae bacterium]|jgi:phosphopantothenoylcysteine decarboxylase/phosphopantothenate--cysteine ligase
MGEPAGKSIILGVTGSIAAYKAASVLRGLMDRDHVVQVVMTPSAQQLVTPTTFRSLSGRPVVCELFIEEGQAGLRHIELSEWVDVLAVVPATANFIGKAANGIADEILSCTWMACDCPKVIAPAMNDRMWASPPVQRNCEYLRLQAGARFVGPVKGKLASGKVAMGHLAPVEDIVEAVHSAATGG